VLEPEKSPTLSLADLQTASSLINVILQPLGFRSEPDVVSVLLRCCVASIDNLCPTFRDDLLVSSIK
jgi:hypothetical protein